MAITRKPLSTSGRASSKPWSKPPPAPCTSRTLGPLPATAYSIGRQGVFAIWLPEAMRARSAPISPRFSRCDLHRASHEVRSRTAKHENTPEPNRPLWSREAQALRKALPGERRSEEHTSELQSRLHLVCRLLLEKKKTRLHDLHQHWR